MYDTKVSTSCFPDVVVNDGATLPGHKTVFGQATVKAPVIFKINIKPIAWLLVDIKFALLKLTLVTDAFTLTLKTVAVDKSNVKLPALILGLLTVSL